VTCAKLVDPCRPRLTRVAAPGGIAVMASLAGWQFVALLVRSLDQR
jgi:hypothetical protein